MADHPDSGPPSEGPKTVFAFPGKPPELANGPATVVNPERRGAPLSDATVSAGARSGVWGRLFPHDSQIAAGEPDLDPAGLQMGQFRIEGRIGVGGMGAVFRARDVRLERPVALKILSPGQARDPSAVQRFQNEARAAARLNHDNIARVYYEGEDHGLPYIAYELVDGVNVRELIARHGQLDCAQVVNYTLQMARALIHTSAAGVIHRDIKPSNIIITPSGQAKLVDLGLARQQWDVGVGELTLAGTTLGTFDYISPEQAKDPRTVDVRSDIYSLGCTVYHMLTGVAPYPEGTVLQKLLDHQGNDPPDASKRNPRVSPELSAVVRRMMASDPRKRYGSPEELLRDLMPIAASLGLRGMHPDGLVWAAPRWQASRFWERNVGWIATVAILLVIVLVLDLFPGLGHQEPPVRRQPVVAQADQKEPTTEAATLPLPGPAANGDASLRPQVVGPVAKAVGDPALPPPERAEEFDAAVPAPEDAPKTAVAQPESPEEQTPSAETAQARVDSAAAVKSDDQLMLPEDLIFDDPELAPVTTGRNIPESVEAPAPPERRKPPLETATIPVPRPVESEPAQITIVGSTAQFYTLESACAAAQNNQIIELNYNGRRPGGAERPLRLANKRITIRAGKDSEGNNYRPTIEFDAQASASESDTRMITLAGGELDLINVDVRVNIPDGSASDQWALFWLQGSERVELKDVCVTFQKASGAPAALVELKPGPGRDLENMNKLDALGGNQPAPEQDFRIKLVDTFVRGNCDLFVVKHHEPGRFVLENSALAIEGTVLSVLGDQDMMPSPAQSFELQLDHVTGVLGNGLILMDSGQEPRQLLPVQVTAENNILATNTSSPLVRMTGSTSADEFHTRLVWNGTNNYYENFEVMWSIAPTIPASMSEELDFEDWKSRWGSGTEVDPKLNAIAWKQPWKSERRFAELELARLELDEASRQSSETWEATDSGNVGVDFSQLAQ